MTEIPLELIESLREIGLLESEAKIYSALVLFHDAEVRELQDFLGLSKPNIYAGLRALENKGFIILTNPKPTTYQAIPPDIALDTWMSAQLRSKEKALEQLRELGSDKANVGKRSNLWFLFGKKHFESKVKDMLKGVKKSVFCVTSGPYLTYIEGIAGSDIDLDLTIIADDKEVQNRLELCVRKKQGKDTDHMQGPDLRFA